MLGKTSIQFLSDNGYKVKQTQDSSVIKHSDSYRYVISCVGALLVLSSLIIMIFSLVFGIVVLAGSILILVKSALKMTGKSTLTLNVRNRRFESVKERWDSISGHFDDVTEIQFYSKFFNEYSSANKSTTKEYTHDVILKLSSNHKIALFRFEGDYSEPSKEENEFLDQLHEIFKGNSR